MMKHRRREASDSLVCVSLLVVHFQAVSAMPRRKILRFESRIQHTAGEVVGALVELFLAHSKSRSTLAIRGTAKAIHESLSELHVQTQSLPHRHEVYQRERKGLKCQP